LHDRFNTIATPAEFIKPLKITNVKPSLFATTDIETMKINNNEIPVLISTCVNGVSKYFLINLNLINEDLDTALQQLWCEYFEFIQKSGVKTVFVHNLGSFDGYFIYKGLIIYNQSSLKKVKTIIDDQNEFISISWKTNTHAITWKDSYRIFGVSLNQLCKVFAVEGKTQIYNEEFNSIKLFSNPIKLKLFLEYAIQDSVALYNALMKAQKYYISMYNVDISSIVSTSTLSFKIFRKHFLKFDIPILTSFEDGFVREAYYGGATDYYKAYAQNVYYYDVNSLYPFAMCRPIPHKISYYISDMSNMELKDFFGFCKVKVTTPNNLLRPVLPYRLDNRTLYPRGSWIATYFSEELKAVARLGYKIELISGFAFTKEYIFNGYVEHFYNLKKNSEGAERFIAKMHLNQLYGYFGRKLDLLETINIPKNELPFYLLTRMVKSVVKISPDIYTILVRNNFNHETLYNLNIELSTNMKSSQYLIKSNVAIAAAVTSYARIHMIPFKQDQNVCYSDTDSIFTTGKLADCYLGKDIGLMKDELKGNVIEEAYFMDIKKYGYWYLDANGNKISSSVFSGVERDTLSFEEVRDIFKGKTIVRNISTRFYKSFKDLTISIDSTHITINNNPVKQLVNNEYQPITLKPFKESSNTLSKLINNFNKLSRSFVKSNIPELYTKLKTNLRIKQL
jgi:hypothetical protein